LLLVRIQLSCKLVHGDLDGLGYSLFISVLEGNVLLRENLAHKLCELSCNLGRCGLLYGELDGTGNLNRCNRGSRSFWFAETITTITRKIVAVITELLCEIENAITTRSKGTVNATGSIGSIGILKSLITFFASIYFSITTEHGNELAGSRAAIGEIRRMEGRFTLFSEEGLENAITAETRLQFTSGAAAIKIPTIAIVTFFCNTNDSITTNTCGSNNGNLENTHGTTTISGEGVSVITFFSRIYGTISTYIICNGGRIGEGERRILGGRIGEGEGGILGGRIGEGEGGILGGSIGEGERRILGGRIGEGEGGTLGGRIGKGERRILGGSIGEGEGGTLGGT